MTTPIYILAGQSNARAMEDAVISELNQRHGAQGYRLVHVSASGAPLTYKRAEDDWHVGTELPDSLTQQTLAALNEFPDGRIAGMIWIQGEGDTHAVARADNYANHLATLMDEFTNEIAQRFTGRDTGVDTAPLVVSGLSTHAPDAEGRDNWEVIRAQQAALAAERANTVLLDPDQIAEAAGVLPPAMFEDGLHYDTGFRDDLAAALVGAVPDLPILAPPPTGLTQGTDGDDILTGTALGDVMTGGSGDDIYILNHRDDRIVELAGEGIDTVQSVFGTSLLRLGQHIENLTLTGTGNHNLRGNARDNTLIGNAGDNVLNGANGRDTLIGGDGNDSFTDPRGRNVLIGGRGDDTYYIDAKIAQIVEHAGEGTDTVVSSISFTLRYHSQYIENLTLTGAEAIDGTGNGLDNLMRGNAAANRLDGAWGDDVIFGNGGDDWLRGHRGDDVLTGGAGADTFVFAAKDGRDRITDFTPGEDVIAFLPGVERNSIQIHGDTIHHSGSDTITLTGWDGTGLTTDDFLFL
ncbi:MAG: hypothetical protein CML02_04050 [Pseudooceanicola sp.]|jgi:hypothetical protein|nr:hypothetical protein [Pseudooceanicola sp.]|tara:strand:+ start:282 stop:1844 length:1563 start_codon:yes stop_codon:yes gene_type:complete